MTRVALFGTGKSGKEVARACIGREDLSLTAVVTHDPAKVGRDAGELMDLGALDIPVGEAVDEGLATKADVLVHTGLGTSAEVAELLGGAAELGLAALTVNGLVHPVTALGADGAAALDARARAGGGRIVGTGVNPGFLLDVLPATWASMAAERGPLRARRVSDIRYWGDGALDHEVRVGADPATVTDSGALSLDESTALLAEAIGRRPDRIDREFEALVAPSRREYRGRVVESGQVHGFRRRSTAICDGEPLIEIEWLAVFCIDPELDGCKEEATVERPGENWFKASTDGFFLRDPYPATAARAINSIAPLLAKPPGLWRPDQLSATP